jgi:hypothetical protein
VPFCRALPGLELGVDKERLEIDSSSFLLLALFLQHSIFLQFSLGDQFAEEGYKEPLS